MDNIFDFKKWINEAFLSVVQKALLAIEKNGIQGKHSFYITFITKHHEVKLSDLLKSKHPETMSIVLEHQFADLKVDKKGFAVTLFFNSQPEKLYIPFKSILFFMDNSINLNIALEPELVTTATKKLKTNPSKAANINKDNIIKFPS